MAKEQDHLPAVVLPYGPLDDLACVLHDLTVKGRSADALVMAEHVERLATVVGDDLTVGFVHQARMYALITLGRLDEALVVVEGLLRFHRATASRTGEAKILGNEAQILIKLGRTDEGLQSLARALWLIDLVPRSNSRYYSAMSSIADAAQAAELYELADETVRIAAEGFPAGSENRAAGEMQRAELQLEWALRLEQLGHREEAAHRFRLGVFLARPWLEANGSAAPLAGALMAVGLAKTGEWPLAQELALGLIGPMRAAGQFHEARLAHVAYGTTLRAHGDLAAARREFAAAAELAEHASQHASRLLFQFELAALAALEEPGPATTTMLTVLRMNSEHLWRLRLERRAMLNQARRRVQLEAAHDRAHLAAVEDALTGLGNRRSFDRQLASVDRRAGDQTGLVLLLVDVDHFKLINDRYSHGVGDAILREVAGVLRAHCRDEDVPVRFGGDEFAVFLRTDLPGAALIAERIRRRVAHRDWSEFGPGLRVTLSLGAAPLVPGMNGPELFDAADRNLYVAKRQGRNQLAAAA